MQHETKLYGPELNPGLPGLEITVSLCIFYKITILLHLHYFIATIVKWGVPIYLPNVPIGQDFWADLSANCSQMVKICN